MPGEGKKQLQNMAVDGLKLYWWLPEPGEKTLKIIPIQLLKHQNKKKHFKAIVWN
ncbi:MAG: hypothetical protein HY394_02200 [Candidatus Diapherotrites archaeon]|nr:hypothetical protein [Candidatus Diapherotrites archaeon]